MKSSAGIEMSPRWLDALLWILILSLPAVTLYILHTWTFWNNIINCLLLFHDEAHLVLARLRKRANIRYLMIAFEYRTEIDWFQYRLG